MFEFENRLPRTFHVASDPVGKRPIMRERSNFIPYSTRLGWEKKSKKLVPLKGPGSVLRTPSDAVVPSLRLSPSVSRE